MRWHHVHNAYTFLILDMEGLATGYSVCSYDGYKSAELLGFLSSQQRPLHLDKSYFYRQLP